MKKTKYALSMLETNTNEEMTEARIYGACLYDMEKEKEKYFNNIADLIKFLSNKHADIIVYDLKFYGAFIIDYLINNKYKQLGQVEFLDKKFKKKSFNIIGDETGNIYSLTILNDYKERYNYRTSKSTKEWKKICFYDIKKMLPVEFEKLGSIADIANNYYINKINKQDNYIMNKEEKQHLLINCKIITKNKKVLDEEGLDRLSISSNAINQYIKIHFYNKNNYRLILPELEDKIDKFCRKAYRGGWTYANPKYVNITDKELYGVSYDINSMYPSIMYNDLLPCGEPIYFKGQYQEDKDYPLYIQKVHIEYLTLNKGHYPFIQVKDNIHYADVNEYIDYAEDIILYLTNMEIEMMKKSYHIVGITYMDGYKFRGTRELFKDYIDIYYEKKRTAKQGSAEREIAKLMLNSLYGKFASKTIRNEITYSMNDEGVINKQVDRYNTFTTSSYYTPLGVFITAYGRCKIVKSADDNYDKFLYSDTDSIHLNLREDEMFNANLNIDVENSGELGLFKIEKIFTDSLFQGAKRYIEYAKEYGKDKYNWELTCAGLPKKTKIKSKEDFKKGTAFKMDIACRVKGGYLIKSEKYTI